MLFMPTELAKSRTCLGPTPTLVRTGGPTPEPSLSTKSLDLDELVVVTWTYDATASLVRASGKGVCTGKNDHAFGIIEFAAVVL